LACWNFIVRVLYLFLWLVYAFYIIYIIFNKGSFKIIDQTFMNGDFIESLNGSTDCVIVIIYIYIYL